MDIAVLTFDGFNEVDSFIAAHILNRLKAKGWAAHITSPTPEVTSMNGVTIRRQRPLEFAAEADAVLIGSGIKACDNAACHPPKTVPVSFDVKVVKEPPTGRRNPAQSPHVH